MAKLLIRAGSTEELDTFVGLANELADYSGGNVWPWPANEPHAFTLVVPRASDEELNEVWRRVREGQAPGAAYSAVQGPSYLFREWTRAQTRPGWQGGSSAGIIEIKHKNTGEVLLRVEGDTLEGAYLAGADLEAADLAGRNLCEAELQGASLIRAELQGARLCHADLRGAALWGASLAHADLESASLWGAPCLRANLSGASLRNADLRGADFTGAILLSADLSSASMMGAWFGLARYDARTRWPEGFNPRMPRAVQVGWFLDGSSSAGAAIDEAQAIEIARRAVAANDSWTGRTAYEVERHGDRWRVHVWQTDGDEVERSRVRDFTEHRCVEMEESGMVVDYTGYGER